MKGYSKSIMYQPLGPYLVCKALGPNGPRGFTNLIWPSGLYIIVIVAVYQPQLIYRVLMSVCVSFRLSVCVCVCVHDNSKNNDSIYLKLEHIVVFENSSEEFDIGHCPIKVKVTA